MFPIGLFGNKVYGVGNYCSHCAHPTRFIGFRFKNLWLCFWHFLMAKAGLPVWFTEQDADINAGRSHLFEYDKMGKRLNDIAN